MVYVYDIETMINFFSAAFIGLEGNEHKVFRIYESVDENININELPELYSFLDLCQGLIGFNNINFDYPVIHKMIEDKDKLLQMSTKEVIDYIYKLSQTVISSKWSNIRESQVKIRQLDLYKILHYDNVNKRTSLKFVQFSMRHHNLQDMPYKHDTMLNYSQMQEIEKYNINDILATRELYKYVIGECDHPVYKGKNKVQLRKKFGSIHKLDLINHNDPKIGSDLLLNLYCRKTGQNIQDVKNWRYEKKEFALKDCILEKINFKEKCFQELLKFFKAQKIIETKKCFSEMDENKVKYLRELKPYMDISRKNGKIENLTIKYKKEKTNITLVYGTGGIHGCISPGIVEATDTHMIVDSDVASLYPSLCVSNRWYPSHLSEDFYHIYKEDIIDKRLWAKKNKDDVTNEGLKLAANGSYGKFIDYNSWLCDPTLGMKITLNGQLFLSMLIERVHEAIPDAFLIQANTDGVTFKIRRDSYATYLQVCKEWEEYSLLTLEHVEYVKMVVRDVNNYIAFKEEIKDNVKKLKEKLKGTFEIVKELHKDTSQSIVPIALLKYYKDQIPVEKTIMEHQDIFDFCKVARDKSGAKFILKRADVDNGEVVNKTLQKINRYYVYNDSKNIKYIKKNRYELVKKDKNVGQLIKRLPPLKTETQIELYRKKIPNQMNMFDFIEDNTKQLQDRETNLESGYLCCIFNRYKQKPIEEYNINYEYYIRECYKIIETITNHY